MNGDPRKKGETGLHVTTAWRHAPTVLAGVVLALFANAFTPVNTDLGWMLSFGRDLLSGGSFLARNVQSFTEPDHLVVRHDWLVSLGGYLLHRSWGAAGVIAGKWALVSAAVIALAIPVTNAARRDITALVTILFAVHVSWIAYELFRAQLFTQIFTAVLVLGLVTGRRLYLWLAVPALTIWANAHGGWLGGLVFLSLFSAVLWVERRLGWAPEGSDVSPAELGLLPVAGLLATFLNPYGFGLHRMSIGVTSSTARLLDREWLPLWRFSELTPGEVHALLLLGGVAALALWFLPRRQLRFWALLGVALALSVSASRHLRLAPVLLAPVVAVALDGALDRFRRVAWAQLDCFARVGSGAAGAVLLGIWVLRVPTALHFIDYPTPSAANALAVMQANGLSGRVWNDFDWGGLMLWTVPQSKVAADGRHLSAYSSELLHTNVTLGYSADDPLLVMDRYGADMALLAPDNPAIPRLATRFSVIYCDRHACLLSKRPEHLAKLEEGLMVPAFDLRPSDLFEHREGPWFELSTTGPIRPVSAQTHAAGQLEARPLESERGR